MHEEEPDVMQYGSYSTRKEAKRVKRRLEASGDYERVWVESEPANYCGGTLRRKSRVLCTS